jgi:hypothetical protein
VVLVVDTNQVTKAAAVAGLAVLELGQVLSLLLEPHIRLQ